MIVIGDSGVGKTAAVRRLCTGEFHPDFASTVGIDYAIKTLVLSGPPGAAAAADAAATDVDMETDIESDGAALVDSLKPPAAGPSGRRKVVGAAKREVTLQIWDTSGQERYMALTRQVRPHWTIFGL